MDDLHRDQDFEAGKIECWSVLIFYIDQPVLSASALKSHRAGRLFLDQSRSGGGVYTRRVARLPG